MKTKKLPPTHPGEILLHDFMEPLGLTQYALAKAIAVTPMRVSQIVRGQRAITADTALARLLAMDFASRARADDSRQPGKPQFQPKAKQVLHIFCPGGASHVDLWDYKPALEKFDGTPLPGEESFVSFQGKNGNLM